MSLLKETTSLNVVRKRTVSAESLGRSTSVTKKKKKVDHDANGEFSFLESLPEVAMRRILSYLPLVGLTNLCAALPGVEKLAKECKLWNHVHVDMWANGWKHFLSVMLPHRNNITAITLQFTEKNVSRRTRNITQTEESRALDNSLLESLSAFEQLKNISIEGAVLSERFLLYLPRHVKTIKLVKCTIFMTGGMLQELSDYGFDGQPWGVRTLITNNGHNGSTSSGNYFFRKVSAKIEEVDISRDCESTVDGFHTTSNAVVLLEGPIYADKLCILPGKSIPIVHSLSCL